jgi:hypothetical protein
MTIEEWLSNVYYDEWGTHIWNEEKDGGSQLVVDIRGWGRIQNEFKTPKEDNEPDIEYRRRTTQAAAKFQDEVGKFIVDAIKEKIERDYKK